MFYAAAQQQKNKRIGRYIPTETGLDISFTTTDDNCWLVGYAYHNGAVVAGTDTTLRGGSASVLQTMDSNAAKTPAGSFSINTTRSPADFAGHVMASLAPAVSAFTSRTTWFM